MNTAVYVSLFLSFSVGGTATAAGHDLYLMPAQFQGAASETVSIEIHSGDEFPTAEGRTSLDKLLNGKIYSSAGKSALSAPSVDGPWAVMSSSTEGDGYRIVTVEAASSIEKMSADDFMDYLEEENLTKIIDLRAKHGDLAVAAMERYTKYAKSIFLAGTADGFFNHEVGLPIEFIPEKDPDQMKLGEQLPVRLLFHGSPAGGLFVMASHTTPQGTVRMPLGRTDPEGRIMVPVNGVSKWRLHAIQMQECLDSSNAEWESFWATLTFETH